MLRRLSILFFIIALLSGGSLFLLNQRERAAAERCSRSRQLIDFETMVCASEVPPQKKFAKRHTWLVGLCSFSTVATLNVGGWWLMLLLNRRQQREMERAAVKRPRKRRS
jgi:hypothetical protein